MLRLSGITILLSSPLRHQDFNPVSTFFISLDTQYSDSLIKVIPCYPRILFMIAKLHFKTHVCPKLDLILFQEVSYNNNNNNNNNNNDDEMGKAL